MPGETGDWKERETGIGEKEVELDAALPDWEQFREAASSLSVCSEAEQSAPHNKLVASHSGARRARSAGDGGRWMVGWKSLLRDGLLQVS